MSLSSHAPFAIDVVDARILLRLGLIGKEGSGAKSAERVIERVPALGGPSRKEAMSSGILHSSEGGGG
jgi:hypothetical protein